MGQIGVIELCLKVVMAKRAACLKKRNQKKICHVVCVTNLRRIIIKFTVFREKTLTWIVTCRHEDLFIAEPGDDANVLAND